MEFIILLSVICIILVYICINLYFKVVKLETLLEQDRVTNIDLLERLVKMFIEANRRLESIDSKKIFKDDDAKDNFFKVTQGTVNFETSQLPLVVEAHNAIEPAVEACTVAEEELKDVREKLSEVKAELVDAGRIERNASAALTTQALQGTAEGKALYEYLKKASSDILPQLGA
jgi:hypothetical protein